MGHSVCVSYLGIPSSYTKGLWNKVLVSSLPSLEVLAASCQILRGLADIFVGGYHDRLGPDPYISVSLEAEIHGNLVIPRRDLCFVRYVAKETK